MDKKEILQSLIKILPEDNILIDEPMSKHTSFKTGGNADFLVKIKSINELKKIIDFSRENNIDVTMIGNGTNLLVRDKGIRGISIILDMKDVSIIENTKDFLVLNSEAGVPIITLSKLAAKYEGEGLEFAVGIPGSLGGAIKMNAGAYGSEIKNVVESTTYILPNGEIKTINSEEHRFEYRSSIFSNTDYIIISSVLKLKKGNKEIIQKRMEENTLSRITKQPIDKPSAGSTFKRGDKYIASELIDKCNLKGFRIGGAEVSKKHAGFVVNAGGATSKDILDVINYVKETVKNKYNVELETEVQIVGEE